MSGSVPWRALTSSNKFSLHPSSQLVTFPECLEQLFETCLEIINGELNSLGLTTIEVVVHEKRNRNQDGYNKVVIVTNELADRVQGKAFDGIVQYP